MIRAPKICGGSHIRAGLSGYVACLGQSFVSAELGLPATLHDSHASYLASWISVLENDKSAIIHAAAKAEQAVAWLRRGGADNAVAPGLAHAA